MSQQGSIAGITVRYECGCCGNEWEDEFNSLRVVDDTQDCEDCTDVGGDCDTCNPECEDCGERNCDGDCDDDEEDEVPPAPASGVVGTDDPAVDSFLSSALGRFAGTPMEGEARRIMDRYERAGTPIPLAVTGAVHAFPGGRHPLAPPDK